MDKGNAEVQNKVRGILERLTESERTLLKSVVDAERNKLYLQRPRGIVDDLMKAVEEIIR